MERGMTSIITTKATGEKGLSSQYEFLEFMADCVIHFDQRVTEQVTTRRLHVIKYRGSGFRGNEHPFIISEEGLSLIPLSAVTLQHAPLGPKVSSGHPRLDTILDGGYRRGACVLISGTSGTGKTSLTCTFVQAACSRGERVLYVSFEEAKESLITSMLSPGIDLRPAVKAGKLEFLTAMPEAMGAEEHLMRAIKAIEQFQPEHMAIDAVSSCKRMGTEQSAFEYVMRLVNICKERGMTCILTNQTEGFQEEHEISGLGISSVADTVIFLRYMEIGGELNRMILTLKSRGSKHSNQYREFLITNRGIDIMDVYAGEDGVLTGIARQEKEAREAAKHRLKAQEIERKKHEVAQRRALFEVQTAKLRADLELAEEELEGLREEMEISQELRKVRARMRGATKANQSRGRSKGGPKGGSK
jgi:circadian clock protein KaiC